MIEGRAALKHRLAATTRFDPATLPYHQQLLSFLTTQKALGRQLFLATAAAGPTAIRIADHLVLFDEVIASDKTTNLAGTTKADALVARFGRGGFVYAGDFRYDLAVWAASAIVVNAASAVTAAIPPHVPVELRIQDCASPARERWRAIWPIHGRRTCLSWCRSSPPTAIADRRLWVDGLIMFAAFCAASLAVYFVKDMLGIDADRAHPAKRERPFARGALSIPTGLAAALALIAAAMVLSASVHALGVLALYIVLSNGYSVRLKELPLLDVCTLASPYALRIVGGGIAIGHVVSLWLLGFSGFTFLSQAPLQRVAELGARQAAGGSGRLARRGYTYEDTPILQMMGCASAFASAVILALFVQSETAAAYYASPSLLWLAVPLVLVWQCRMWLAASCCSSRSISVQ